MGPIEARAWFTTCNIKAGKVVMQFELDPEDRPLLSQLAGTTGLKVMLTIDNPQQTLFVDRESGEVIDELEEDEGENEWEATPYELPPAAYQYEDYEDEDAA